MPSYHNMPRQPFAGRSGNTMFSGMGGSKLKHVDSVRSLNEIALRDAAELQMMLQRQAQQLQTQIARPPAGIEGSYPPGQGVVFPATQGSYGQMQNYHGPSRHPHLSGRPQSLDHSQDEDTYVGQQNRSFSLHTAPLPASWNDGSFQATFSDAKPRAEPEQIAGFHHVTTHKYIPVPSTTGPFGRRGRTSSSTQLDETAFDGDCTYDPPGQEFTFINHRAPSVAPAWAKVPPSPPSPGGEMCDYVQPVLQTSKPTRRAPPPAPPAEQVAIPAPPGEPCTKKDMQAEDITISFKPKVNLLKGNTVSQVRLVLADFEGADADYIKLDSVPHRAFIGAYWTSKTKELALILGDDVAAQTPVTVIIPASSGIRRLPPVEKTVDAPVAPQRPSKDGPTRNIAAIIKAAENQSVPSNAAEAPATQHETNLVHEEEMPRNETEASMAPEKEDAARQYGIDVKLAWSDEVRAYVISEVVRGGAAWKNGFINVGNVVTHIDENPLEAMSTEQVAQCLLGEPSTAVVLTIRDHVDPLSGQVQTRDVKVMRYDAAEMTMDFYDEEEFCDIPETKEEDDEVVSQAEWARRQLSQKPKEVTKMVDMNDISKKVSDQSKAAKEKLQTRSSITKTEYDAESVAQQARWAKEQLDNREDRTQKTVFDAEMVAEQTRMAMASLANLPQKVVEKNFDDQAVAQQAKWAKQQLENRPDTTKMTSIDTASVSEQAQWAKKKLLAKEQGLNDESLQQEPQNSGEPAAPAPAAAVETVVPPTASESAPTAEGASSEDAAERKRRAQQKRLEFLAMTANSKQSSESNVTLQTAAPVAPVAQAPEAPLTQAPAALVPTGIVLAPSPVEGESAPTSPRIQKEQSPPEARTPAPPTKSSFGDALDELCRLAGLDDLPGMDEVLVHKSPDAQPPVQRSAEMAKPEIQAPEAAPQQQEHTQPVQPPVQPPVLMPRSSSLASSRSDAGPVDLNSSALPPPTKNFLDTSQRESLAPASREINTEEELQFLEALTKPKVITCD